MKDKKLQFEIGLTFAALFTSLILCVLWVYLMVGSIVSDWTVSLFRGVEQAVFLLIGISLLYGSIIYLLTRLGRLLRDRSVSYPAEREIDKYFFSQDKSAPTLSILVPSYKEELRVIEMTLLSACLLEYPQLNVVLLVDDPLPPANQPNSSLLNSTLTLPAKLNSEFSEVHTQVERAYRDFRTRTADQVEIKSEIIHLAEVYEILKKWYDKRRSEFEAKDHAERFFSSYVLTKGRDRIQDLCNEVYALQEKTVVSLEELEFHYRKVLSIFNVSVNVFQRKRYENLSHEPNKAMNLNSYIGLIGRTFRVEKSDQGGVERLIEDQAGELTVSPADYVITLDADSMLAFDYAKRLIHFMEQPESSRVAVAQTPYNTFKCPFINIEYIAGATTDIQFLIHQGFEYFKASFWVGANALLRVSALEDIKERDVERGHTVYRYIQDRTVIEDTESTIDFAKKNWYVYNYLASLAYSATPPDFGSLIIQRRRWANGGLIIFPKLLDYFLSNRQSWRHKFLEFFVRAHYLTSIALVNIGLVLMMIFPFSGGKYILVLSGPALIYFFMYRRDLVKLGYRNLDIFRIYALNLLLIAINLAGVLKSIQQMITKEKIPFGRTPKVQDRTTASPFFVLFIIFITIYLLIGTFVDLFFQRYEHALFSLINGGFFLYACLVYIGWREALTDLWGNRRTF